MSTECMFHLPLPAAQRCATLNEGQQLACTVQVQSAAEQASPVKSVGIQQLRSGRPDSALVKQLQAQLSGLAAQLEAVTEQLAAASQAATDEQRKAQVCPGLTLDYISMSAKFTRRKGSCLTSA